MTFGAATAGEILVDRYRLEEHIDTDTSGRQIWRGADTILRRPVALVIRQPGGEAAAGMLTVAVSASRLVHPHLVSVYDAIDEGHRAYVVREWVPGVALRDVLGQSPLDAERATLVTHAVAEATAALHAANIVHGNIHPGTILIADDGRVVLLDAHADAPTDPEFDVRAIGAVLYACLTGHWPYAEAGRSALPDAIRDAHGRISRPRQVLGGIPRHLDEIATELLEPAVEPPPAAALAAEFARLATNGEPDYDDGAGYEDYDDDQRHHGSGPMGFGPDRGSVRRFTGGKLALGIAALTVIAVIGVYVGVRALTNDPAPGPTSPAPVASASTSPSGNGGKPLALRSDQIRIVDPPNGDRTELDGFEKVIDGNESTGWRTDQYNQANFGGIKPGMGILVNLGAPTKVTAVRVIVDKQGASVGLLAGTSAPNSSSEGDKTIIESFTPVGPSLDDHPGTNMVLPVPEDTQTVQYLLVWITKLPQADTGKFVITVNEIVVLTP
jgi:hypothetical protein